MLPREFLRSLSQPGGAYLSVIDELFGEAVEVLRHVDEQLATRLPMTFGSHHWFA